LAASNQVEEMVISNIDDQNNSHQPQQATTTTANNQQQPVWDAIDEDEISAIVEWCQQVDGLPWPPVDVSLLIDLDINNQQQQQQQQQPVNEYIDDLTGVDMDEFFGGW